MLWLQHLSSVICQSNGVFYSVGILFLKVILILLATLI